MKTFVSIVCILLSTSVYCQRFSFLPEAGMLMTQIDGDKLQGYHKRGVLLGIGTHYALSNNINLGIKTSFYRQGSARKDAFQDKLEDGIQLEMGLSTVGLEVSTVYEPIDKSIFLGVGFVHHQILNYDYKIIDNVVAGPPRLLDPTTVSSSFNNIKFFLGWRFSTSYRFTIAYEKSFSDILDEDFFNIARLLPYHLAFTMSYEFNPSKKKKGKQKRSRKTRK
ncbi:MAG: hypothetical protein P1U56_07325 [Saprospiraceae bacterium]|nr:hypothetical protein [Saprospiraceae bacterium]